MAASSPTSKKPANIRAVKIPRLIINSVKIGDPKYAMIHTIGSSGMQLGAT